MPCSMIPSFLKRMIESFLYKMELYERGVLETLLFVDSKKYKRSWLVIKKETVRVPCSGTDFVVIY